VPELPPLVEAGVVPAPPQRTASNPHNVADAKPSPRVENATFMKSPRRFGKAASLTRTLAPGGTAP
jgi:hypothetical protein